MKNLLLLITLIGILFSSNVSYSQSVTFNVTTVTDNGNFSPRHILAIWVEDANGTFVKSLKVNAAARIQYLYTWKTKSGSNKVDAITGATLQAHQSHTVTWNCKNVNGAIVSPGTYKLVIEFTDQHAQGPLNTLNFVISGSAQHVTQPDAAYFKNISLDFTPPTSTGIGENKTGNQVLSVYPNPSNGVFYISLAAEEQSTVNVKVFDLRGSIVHQEQVQSDKLNGFPIQLSSLSKGTYILELTNNQKVISQKLVLY